MRQLAYLGAVALVTVAAFGAGCSSNNDNNAAVGGGASVGGQAGMGGASSSHTGGSNAGGKSAGGATSAGGDLGTGGTPVVPLTDGMPLDGNYLTIGNLKGVIWTTWDTKVAGTPGSTITQVDGKTCAYGVAAKVTCTDATKTDCAYSTYWGVDLGWNLNQPKDADGGVSDTPLPADLSAFTSVSFDFDGASDPPLPLRIQLTVPDPAGGTESYYCSRIATAALPQTIALANLKTNCWPGGTPQVAFDPATMKPTNLAIQVFTDVDKAYPFNFCLTKLTFDTQ